MRNEERKATVAICVSWMLALVLVAGSAAAAPEAEERGIVPLRVVLTECAGAWVVEPEPTKLEAPVVSFVVRETLRGDPLPSSRLEIAADDLPVLPGSQRFLDQHAGRGLLLLADERGDPAWLGFPLMENSALLEIAPLGDRARPLPSLVAMCTVERAWQTGELAYVVEGPLLLGAEEIVLRVDLATDDLASGEVSAQVTGLPPFAGLADKPVAALLPADAGGMWANPTGLLQLDFGTSEERPLQIWGEVSEPATTDAPYPARFHLRTPAIVDPSTLAEYVGDPNLLPGIARFRVDSENGEVWTLAVSTASGPPLKLVDPRGDTVPYSFSSGSWGWTRLEQGRSYQLKVFHVFTQQEPDAWLLMVPFDERGAAFELAYHSMFSGQSTAGGHAGTLLRATSQGPSPCRIGPRPPPIPVDHSLREQSTLPGCRLTLLENGFETQP